MWNAGKRFGKIPPSEYDIPEPEKPADDKDIAARTNYKIRYSAWQQDKANAHSERCSVNYKIEIARTVSGLYRLSGELTLT